MMLLSHRLAIRQALTMSETDALARFIQLTPNTTERRTITQQAAQLIDEIRNEQSPSLMESMLAEYGLSTEEGIALMCLAEAMLRVPDTATVNELIEDKIADANWSGHRGQSPSSLINASTWGLMLTGKILSVEESSGVFRTLHHLVKRLSEPVIRTAVSEMLKRLGTQFVLGENITVALKNSNPPYTYSYDMLGEGAKTEADALRYFASYRDTILKLAPLCVHETVADNPGISVKLSALFARYEYAQRADVLNILVKRTTELAELAAQANMGFNIDAEEVDRLDLSLDVIEAVLKNDSLKNWDGFGVVVQAYGKRAPEVLEWLYELVRVLDRRIMVRLVKGAYWDAEIKRAQALGLDDFSVYTHKAHSDVAYLACARQLIQMNDRIYPQFATHNAHTMTAILHFIDDSKQTISFEFQRLHGMGESLHHTVLTKYQTRCRIYAPVGAHRDLLAYLVRRLLENGANGSFVNQMADVSIPSAHVASDPWAAIANHHAVVKPTQLFEPCRHNSKGWDLTDPLTLAHIYSTQEHLSFAFNGKIAIRNPSNLTQIIGHVQYASLDEVKTAITQAVNAQADWASRPVSERAECLYRLADAYEAAAPRLFALLTQESGKTLVDAVSEVREAVDFCRYYAANAKYYQNPVGVVTCISPWNFPMAIFTGQIVAALVTGNAVLAKPAEQTPLIAIELVQLMHESGIPQNIVQLLCGEGSTVGAALTSDPRIKGVVFTGSSVTAKLIQKNMADHLHPDAMLIAETGGLNAMIVDSSALPEQVVRDVVASAFQSAGQRCSALRILYVQEDVAEHMIEMISGAMDLLKIGNPRDLSTDIGPVIDIDAQNELTAYIQNHDVIKTIACPDTGYFVPPTMVRVSGINAMEKEMFGPILHIATFKARELSKVIKDINQAGYGLTLGVHSRIDTRVNTICANAHIGNIYVNRNQIGAIVGSQPFGGHGLSGTGPKAGGALYLSKFAQKITDNTNTSMDVHKAKRIASITAILPQELRVSWQKVLLASSALNLSPQHLPGPTGERNVYQQIPRGTIACLGGPDPQDIEQQVLAALLCGNKIHMLEAPSWLSMLHSYGDIHCVDTIDISQIDVVALFNDTDAQHMWQHQLAQYNDLVIPLMTHLFDVALLVHEVHICTDTTAAGGNAELLAQTT